MPPATMESVQKCSRCSTSRSSIRLMPRRKVSLLFTSIQIFYFPCVFIVINALKSLRLADIELVEDFKIMKAAAQAIVVVVTSRNDSSVITHSCSRSTRRLRPDPVTTSAYICYRYISLLGWRGYRRPVAIVPTTRIYGELYGCLALASSNELPPECTLNLPRPPDERRRFIYPLTFI